MLPPIADWSEETLEHIKALPELMRLELKASDALSPTKGGSRDANTILAREVCAFANSTGGFLVYGFSNPSTGIPAALDGGVPETIGKEHVKSWVERKIPDLLHPRLHRCEAKLIQVKAHHAPGRGALVIEVPLSEHRPHWIIEQSREIPYIRAGEHSLPMSLQTFQDLITRRGAAAGEIIQLLEGKGDASLKKFDPGQRDHAQFMLSPQVQLTAGVICERWAFELYTSPNFGLYPAKGNDTAVIPLGQRIRSGWAFPGSAPLFLHRPTEVCPSPNRIVVNVSIDTFDDAFISAVLYLEGAVPVRKTYLVREIVNRPS